MTRLPTTIQRVLGSAVFVLALGAVVATTTTSGVTIAQSAAPLTHAYAEVRLEPGQTATVRLSAHVDAAPAHMDHAQTRVSLLVQSVATGDTTVVVRPAWALADGPLATLDGERDSETLTLYADRTWSVTPRAWDWDARLVFSNHGPEVSRVYLELTVEFLDADLGAPTHARATVTVEQVVGDPDEVDTADTGESEDTADTGL